MKKLFLWLVLGLVLLVGGGALAGSGLHIAVLTVTGVVLAVAGFIIVFACLFAMDLW